MTMADSGAYCSSPADSYARLFKEQGFCVVCVNGISWFDYNGCMVPAFLPHCVPAIRREDVRDVLSRSGRLMGRWISHYGQVHDSPWWYVLRKGPWDMEKVDDKKKRWMIRQGRKNFTVRPLTFEEVLTDCASVAARAAARYKGPADVETQDTFVRRVEAARRVPGVAEYIGCFHEDQLVSFSENYIQDNAVFLNVIRHDPAFLNKYSGYAIIDWMLTHYLNERGMKYVLDGSRSIYHTTNIQDHLESVYGFTREYAVLNIAYSPWLKVPLNGLYPCRKAFFFVAQRMPWNSMKKFAALLNQEQIVRSCKDVHLLSADAGSPRDSAAAPAPVTIVPIVEDVISGVAQLHITGIQGSFLGSLGPSLVKYLYQAILKSNRAFGFVAVRSGEVIGFITAAESVSAVYKDVMGKHFVPLAVTLLPKVLKWRNLKYAVETLFYPLKIKEDLPQAEILSVVVSEKARGLGVGRKLMQAALDEFKKRGITEIKVLVGERLAANEYYKQMAFQLKGEYHHHGGKLNVYTTKLINN